MKYWEARVELALFGNELFEEDELTRDEYTMRMRYEEIVCKFCGSPDIVKNGTFRGTQRWLCRNCSRAFVDNKALPKMKCSIAEVSSAVGMYFRGMSLNDISSQLLAQYGYGPTDAAIYSWVTRFTKVAIDKVKDYKPEVGDTWIADETMLRIGGKKYWLWDIIDRDTRFMLATHPSLTRTTKDAQKLMELASKRAGKVPKVVITDKLQAYLDGIELTFGADTKHIQSTPFTDEDSTNIIERFQGTLKDRTKVMRGMKKLETARIILRGWLVYYNYFRPHESLNGKTPAEAAKSEYPFKNWLDVVNSQAGVIHQGDGSRIVATTPAYIPTFPLGRKPAYRKRSKKFKAKRQTTPTLTQPRLKRKEV